MSSGAFASGPIQNVVPCEANMVLKPVKGLTDGLICSVCGVQHRKKNMLKHTHTEELICRICATQYMLDTAKGLANAS